MALISGKVPFVLRPVGGGDDDGTSSFDNLFWLVGDCYLCGIWKAKLCITPPARARGCAVYSRTPEHVTDKGVGRAKGKRLGPKT